MNSKIQKVREDIRRAEAKQREITEYLKTLRLKEKQLCDDEIIKAMRQMAGKGGDVMEILAKLKADDVPEQATKVEPAIFMEPETRTEEEEEEQDED